MEEKLPRDGVQQAPFGYAYHKLVCSTDGLQEDYIFLDVNPAFEEMTGLRKENIIGKKVTEAITNIKKDSFDWINFYGQIAVKGGKEEFIQYSKPLKRWYKVTAFSWQQGYFATYIQEITAEMERIRIMEKQQEAIDKITLEMEKVFNGTHDAMFLVKVEKGELRYLRSNSAHQELTVFLWRCSEKTPVETGRKRIRGGHCGQLPEMPGNRGNNNL
jgi:PAS domain S-box-containing protein